MEVILGKLRLFIVKFAGPEPCVKLQVAENAEDAFLECFNKHSARDGHERASCKVEEAKVEGYSIVVTPATDTG